MLKHTRGFTLIEILMVVVIIGILASIVVPQFTDASTDAKLNALKTNLQTIRAQIQMYRMEHNGNYPTDVNSFITQMTMASKQDGSTAAIGTAGFNFGPYLQSIPNNPYTGNNVLGSGGIGSSDWYYDGTTGQFRANHHADYVDY